MAAAVTNGWQRSTRCGGGDCVEVWHKSSYSSDTANCVEVAEQPGTVLVRDSKDPDGPRLAFGGPAWTAFIAAIKNDELQ